MSAEEELNTAPKTMGPYFLLAHRPFKLQSRRWPSAKCQVPRGICAHVDLMRFEDGIAIISLESSCVMHFSSVEAEVKGSVVPAAKIPVLLTPGSLVLMWGEARYLWKHEIDRKPGFQIWQGREINQKRRVSMTFRRLCRTE